MTRQLSLRARGTRRAAQLALAWALASGTGVRADDPPPPAPPPPVAPPAKPPTAPPAVGPGQAGSPAPDPQTLLPLLARLAEEEDSPARAEAVVTWKALASADRVAVVRLGLRSDDPVTAFAAAAVASPWNLDLEELHRVGRALELHPLARWTSFAATQEAGEGSLLVGSSDLAAFWKALALRDATAEGVDLSAPHRLLLPADGPALAPLLATATPTTFRALLWDLSNEADNEAGDERHADYVRTFRYALARLRAEAAKKPVPKWPGAAPTAKKTGLPAELVELLEATCGPAGRGFDLGRLPEPPPKPGEKKVAPPPAAEGPARWIHRWALRCEPGVEDLDFLSRLLVAQRVVPQTRWWAARQVARLSIGNGLAGRASGRALHDVLAQGDDAAFFAAAELASKGSREDWDRLSASAGRDRDDVVVMARWLADPDAARAAAWKVLAGGQVPQDLAEGERSFRAYDVGIATRPGDLAWIAGKLREAGTSVSAEAWCVVQGVTPPLDAKQAEDRLARWSARVAEIDAFDDDVRDALALFEPFAPDAVVAFARRLATETKEEDVRTAVLGVLARLGDAELVGAMLAGDRVLKAHDGRLLGRVRDPRVEAYLRERAASTDPELEGAALGALAIFYGAPEPLAGYFDATTRPKEEPAADAWDAAKALVLAKDPIGAVLARTASGPTLTQGSVTLEVTSGLGLSSDPRVAERLRAWRDERASGLYWVATACLALGGDEAARAQWRSFLGEARTFLLDDLQDGRLFTMDGDAAFVADWVARLDANCCFSWHAHSVIKATFPTMPYDHAPGDAGRARRAIEGWFARHRGTFVRSRLLGGFVPGPSK